MNDNSWESLLKKQQKKFHFAILLLTPVIALAIIIIINNRDFILEKNNKLPKTASIAHPPIPAEKNKALDLPHDSSFSNPHEKPLPSSVKNGSHSTTEHEQSRVAAPFEKQKSALVKQSANLADKQRQIPGVKVTPASHADVTKEKKKPALPTERAVFSIHPEPSKKATPKILPPQKSNQHPQESAQTNNSIDSAPITKKQPASTKSSNHHPLQPQSLQSSPSEPVVPAPAHSPTKDHAAKEAIVKQVADIVFSEELPPITCHLQSRKDVVIKLTLELFFHDEDSRRPLRLQRDKIRLVVQQMVKPKELSEMNVGSLEIQLLENVHRILDPAMITSVKIKNIQIEKALSE